jgi:two-component system sensor histidine kinase/response regulator
MLVLIAEDSDTLRDVLTKQISSLGHEVHAVCNGWHAVLSCHAHTYDVILMDMHMPVMDGWDATTQIRDFEQSHGKKRMPIVAVTSLFDRQACIAGGMDDYISKPYSQMQLYAVLTRWRVKQKAQRTVVRNTLALEVPPQPGA